MNEPYGLASERESSDGEQILCELHKIALTAAIRPAPLALDIAAPLRDGCRHDAPDPYLPDHHH
jgi:hypothetical protein